MEKRKSVLTEKTINMIKKRNHSMDLKSTKEMVQSLNKDGIIIDVSPGWLSMTGYVREEAIGHFFGEFLVDESLLKTKREFPHLKDYGFVDNVSLKVRRKDGVVMEVALNGTSQYSDEGEFERTFCELRTLDYYMRSVHAINQLLVYEKFLKTIMYIKANISSILLNKVDYDYYNALSEILNEPPEIIQAVIEPIPEKFEFLDENKKSIIKYAKETFSKNTITEEKKVFIIEKKSSLEFPISSEYEDYSMITKINDNSMPNKERLLIIDFNSSEELLQEWIEAFMNISEIIESVIQSLEINLKNKALITELKRLCETDRLTNIYNRMMLDKILINQKNNYEGHNKNCSIIIVDIDHFKKVNDTYGHNVGDKVLCEIANLLKSNIRNTDVVGRWGGEEFLIICEDTDLSNGMILSESLRKEIQCYSFTGVNKLTASFGVSEFSNGVTIEQVIGKADKALYKAKTEGRNRVRCCVSSY
ncbi:sensor domain-containing diguanylate cyclase [Oceanirhabdus seepicola]|uniref:GGDEF domain-containing protein n=1 Tax=Oceanirhabdus seepicola TaxID=2828781 RepID=A0A9J6P6C4_9CLOT|nr:GGDEF domain-containing protein [Oceanirhabdus seepicola]MCM1991678.1 GGDEF domain-containing protein [Oceanirhabdus seepicola]